MGHIAYQRWTAGWRKRAKAVKNGRRTTVPVTVSSGAAGAASLPRGRYIGAVRLGGGGEGADPPGAGSSTIGPRTRDSPVMRLARYWKLVIVSWNGTFVPPNGCTSAYQEPATGVAMSIDSYTPALSDLASKTSVVGGAPCFR